MTGHIDYRNRFMGHDLADFAQEFLIRNSDYRDELQASVQASSMKARASIALKWGLEFRCSGGPECGALPGTVASF